MDLRVVEATLPPGFRFYPSDEELVCHYLYKKIFNERLPRGTMVEIDLHTCEPWQLPDVAKLGANEWYFFSFRERKYSTGLRTNRATKAGYWKATGKDRTVLDSTTSSIVGMRKTLVFYHGRAPNGIKTGWVMYEFRLQMSHLPSKDWVLCRVFYKSQGGEGDQLPTNSTIDNDLDVTAFASSPPTGQTMQEGQCQQQYISFSQTPLYQQETNHQGCLLETSTLINPSFAPECGGENEYGFLYNMELQD